MRYADYFIVVTTVLLLFLSFFLDRFFADFYRRKRPRSEKGTWIYRTMDTISRTEVLLFALALLSAYVFLQTHPLKQAWIELLYLWAGVSGVMLLVYLIKMLIARARPVAEKFISFTRLKDYSFPSAHSAFVFSVFAITDDHFTAAKAVWIFFAVLVAASRIYLEMHYLSDVVAGSLLGYFAGAILVGSTSINYIIIGTALAFFAMLTLGKLYKINTQGPKL